MQALVSIIPVAELNPFPLSRLSARLSLQCFFLSPIYFFLSPPKFSLSAQKYFVTKFVTLVRNFVTHITKFVILVTKFVTNFSCADSDKYQAGRKN